LVPVSILVSSSVLFLFFRLFFAPWHRLLVCLHLAAWLFRIYLQKVSEETIHRASETDSGTYADQLVFSNEHTLRHLTIEETEKIKPAHSQEQANPEIPAAQRPSTIQRSVRLALCISLVWAYPLDSSRRQKQLT